MACSSGYWLEAVMFRFLIRAEADEHHHEEREAQRGKAATEIGISRAKIAKGAKKN